VTLPGHFLGATDGEAHFAPDLDQTIAWGDERYLQFRCLVDNLVSARGLQPPALGDPKPFTSSAPNSIHLADRVGEDAAIVARTAYSASR
jgi:hypothetical protein